MQNVVQEKPFKAQVIEIIPHMRALARVMCGNSHEAEDISQEALANAWAARESFTPGTNLKAWLCMIVRNEFYSRVRRAWRTTSLDPVVAERILVANDNPTAALELDEMRRALAQLPPEQREALTLIGAGGFAYDEVAGMCGVAVGTVKSRVSRARDQLALIFAENSFGRDNMPAGAAMKSIMADVEGFRAARCA